jgi:hydroxymethylbilane synthase
MLQVIRTVGDRILDAPLSNIGDKGLFTSEIERALLDGEIDIAVHSLKDLPTQLPDGLIIGAVCEREEVRDVFVPHARNSRKRLPGQKPGAIVATGSLRRRSQLLNRWPHLKIADIRGNIGTRFRKLEESEWAGMVLAAAGVKRLGLMERVGELLGFEVMLPAVGQGALAVEIRVDDSRTAAIVGTVNDEPTRKAVTAERALLRTLEGGCHVPIGAYARIEPDANRMPVLVLDAYIGSLDGKDAIRDTLTGRPDEPERIGEELARKLLQGGGGRILDAIRDGERTHQPPA